MPQPAEPSSEVTSATPGRSQAVEDTLAQARANALKRLEARRKGQSGDAAQLSDTPASSSIATPATPQTSSRPSPFGSLFTPPADAETPTKPSTAAFSPASISRASQLPIGSPAKSRYVPSGLSASSTPPASSSLSSKDKYGSISSSDRRRLGRHLPRIASGEGGPETLEPVKVVRRQPSNLGRDSIILPSSLGDTSASPPPNKAGDVLQPSTLDNVPSTPQGTIHTPSTKRRSYLPNTITPTSKTLKPRAEVAGDEMKGLMNAVGSLPAKGTDDGEAVTGMSNRLRLSRAALPPSASSTTLAPAPLPSRRLMQSNWMDKQRHTLASYEYLCHIGEAQQWIEGCLGEETGFGVTEMDEGLRDGVVLAKLARVFQGEQVVKKIWTDSKHRYKQVDNIDHFMKFIRTVGMPQVFTFDPIDLYEKKNIPKVIFCIHVLSHLLSRQGLAERIGDLVGQFEFTDEQLAKTQKGIQGVAMPNFGDARKTLAKEASWAPEEPEETEEERRDRELLGCAPSIVKLQQHLRGQLARARANRTKYHLDLAMPVIVRFQARARGAMCRSRLIAQREAEEDLYDWASDLQSAARRHLAVIRLTRQYRDLSRAATSIIGIQAHARAKLAHTRHKQAQKTLYSSTEAITGIQSACRRHLACAARSRVRTSCSEAATRQSIVQLQAMCRGHLIRQRDGSLLDILDAMVGIHIAVQSQIRGALARRKQKAREEKLDDASAYIVAIQSTARGVLARRKKQAYVEHVQEAMPVLSLLQAAARARLAKQSHQSMQKALSKVEMAGNIGGLQSFLRTRLAKKQNTEQKKKLEFVQPDVIGFQACARGYLARQEYNEWREYLQDPHTQGALVFLQSLIRGFLARRRLWIRTSYLHTNVDQVIKIQSLWRGRAERLMYDRLLTGRGVDVPTIQNYMHLLDDRDTDYQRQIHTENLRREVVRLIRENQMLETEVKELDTKIALILKNKMTFEELVHAKRSARGPGEQSVSHEGWKDSTTRDPFTTHAHMDRSSQRKLELFEYLFFLLQTRGEYISRLLYDLMRREDAEQERVLVESVTLVLFSYGQETREMFLFAKLLQLAVHEEILRSTSLEELADARFAITSVAMQYTREAITPLLQGVLGEHVARVMQAQDLDLSTDPVEIYQRLINEEESRTGMGSMKPRNLDGNQILQTDESTRAFYIQHLQELRHLTKRMLETVYQSTAHLPYTVRLLAREALLALRVKFPDVSDELLTPIVARAVVFPFILPAIIAPESFGIVEHGIGAQERRNLAAIANLITHVAAQDFTSSKDHFVRTPLQEFIRSEGISFRDWVLDVASVEPLESFYQADDLLESTVEAKPIMITRNEIYGMLSTLIKNIAAFYGGKQNDPLVAVLGELEGPPINYDRSEAVVSLNVNNRLAEVQPGGPEEQEKEDWVQAKRHVLAVLRVQTGKTLFEVLVNSPTEVHETVWLELVYADMARDEGKRARKELPSTPVEASYQIESIRSLPFHEVKVRAIEFCMKLERAGRLTRENAFADLLDSIAGDIRQKHHLRKMQRQNAVAMERAHEDMWRKHQGFEEQIKSYHQFIDSSLASLQKGKKKPTFLSKQYFHQRAEAKSGKRSQFGSYKYTAADLYERGILLGINQLSPNVFNEVNIIIASDEVGVFALELHSSTVSIPVSRGSTREEIRMEDLLQAQFENELNLLLFDGVATFSINMLIHQINKSECGLAKWWLIDCRVLFLIGDRHDRRSHVGYYDCTRL
ncbi:hypothetical protein BD324DRAFT_576164 [Kockovaella imperatae]|uniref:Ras GTPase activating protein n=1 Tax=Kockovaella imperatae TaxID=4999 RepID=A0A1Y1URS6_9TREE|nr:hypothetical protein BD324DRAFT_576164 [Kockovaella imperatae]ORX39865.1 hypothetical protein BD324DRAFT_576164 [Kockovaella imperatae]